MNLSVEVLEPASGIDSVQAVGESGVIALVSTDDARAATAVYSMDGGLSFGRSSTGLAEYDTAATSTTVTYPELIVAGSRIVATSGNSVQQPDSGVISTGVAVSENGGQSWKMIEIAVDPDASPGASAVIHAAAEFNGVLYLGGSLRLDNTDRGALWVVSADGVVTSVPLAETVLSAIASITSLTAYEGTLYVAADNAYGTQGSYALYESPDGQTWTLTFADSTINGASGLAVVDGSLYVELGIQAAVLVEGSWHTIELDIGGDGVPAEFFDPASSVPTEDGSSVVTLVEDAACDCSIAYAGVLTPSEVDVAELDVAELDFGFCSIQSGTWTGIGPPARVNGVVVAFGFCEDEGAVAWSESGELDEWETALATDLSLALDVGPVESVALADRVVGFAMDDARLIALTLAA